MLTTISTFDHSALNALYAARDPVVLAFFLQVTAWGGVIALLSISGVVMLILAVRHRIAEVLGLTITLLGTAFASTVIKHLVARPRPSFFYQAYPETGYSFPSEHTALATALCTFLVYLVFRLPRHAGVSRRAFFLHAEAWRTIAFCLALIVVAGVAFSRVYLGVHYVSDVVGGLVLGSIMALIGMKIERSLEHLNLRK